MNGEAETDSKQELPRWGTCKAAAQIINVSGADMGS